MCYAWIAAWGRKTGITLPARAVTILRPAPMASCTQQNVSPDWNSIRVETNVSGLPLPLAVSITANTKSWISCYQVMMRCFHLLEQEIHDPNNPIWGFHIVVAALCWEMLYSSNMNLHLNLYTIKHSQRLVEYWLMSWQKLRDCLSICLSDG